MHGGTQKRPAFFVRCAAKRVVVAQAKMVGCQQTVRNRTRFRRLVGTAFLTALAGLTGGAVYAQDAQAPSAPALAQQPITAPLQEEAIQNAAAPCVEPPPMVRIEDYDGPLKKVVGTFARPLERKAVPLPHYKTGVKLCTLTLKGKFVLFVQDSLDPVTFLGAAFDAGLDQAENNDPSYGQGAEGYGRRYGAEFAGQASSRFFKDFAYPSIFSEDPRYYRLAHGKFGRRLLHAVEHAVVAHRDNGKQMFNYSEWLGTASTSVLSNTYHPDNRRGFAPAAERVGYSILQDTGFDVLREFWPEISRKFRLPFRGQAPPVSPKPNSATP
jgi:hypothetical protein